MASYYFARGWTAGAAIVLLHTLAVSALGNAPIGSERSPLWFPPWPRQPERQNIRFVGSIPLHVTDWGDKGDSLVSTSTLTSSWGQWKPVSQSVPEWDITDPASSARLLFTESPDLHRLSDGAAPFAIRRSNEQDSRILIPRKFLASALGKEIASPPLYNRAQQNTIYGGVLLATVLSGGGLTAAFIRRGKVRAAVVSAVVFLTLSAVVGTAMANMAPRLVTEKEVREAEAEYRRLFPEPKIDVEVTETGDRVVLILGQRSPMP